MKVTANKSGSDGTTSHRSLADAVSPAPADVSMVQNVITASDGPAAGRSRPGATASMADAATGNSIEQLRDIIFGGQMRDFDKRFVRVEERLVKEVNELRDEMRQRQSALERFVHDEMESLTRDLRTEQQSRAMEESRITQSLADAAKAADERIAATTELTAKHHRELRAQLLEQRQAITDESQRRHSEVRALIAQEADQLRDDKADRSSLSALFLELALRLRGESVVPPER
jgi:hypothetical protein